MAEQQSPTAARSDADRYRTLLDITNALISNLTHESLFQAIARALYRSFPSIGSRSPPRFRQGRPPSLHALLGVSAGAAAAKDERMLPITFATNSVPETDQALLARVGQGDRDALDGLIERYSGRVYRLAVGITGNAADAEEVVQDVLVTVVQKGHTFEGRAAVSSWIHRITVNAALVKRRARHAEREVSLDALLPAFHADGHRAGDPALLKLDWSQTPESQLLSRETQAVVRAAIESLPETYRVVLALRDIEGLSNEEVAAAIQDSVGAVKSRLHRARMALREVLTRHFAAPAAAGDGEGLPAATA
jgi:RNA polymerase sigma-70 factor (ECF subfamily)